MKSYPALDVKGADNELVLAVADDYSPAAVEESDGMFTIFFSDPLARDGARDAIAHAFPAAQVEARDVDDGDWARRSQDNLGPVTVGRITVAPPWRRLSFTGAGAPPPARSYADASPRRRLASARHGRGRFFTGAGAPPPLVLTIQPSMGFGTGHHATTRLCLAALQTLKIEGASVLDVGTGSGVLALAARALGARRVLGIDNDPDAVRCARENLTLNPGPDRVTFEVADVGAIPIVSRDERAARQDDVSTRADVIAANLTGALLCRIAAVLGAALVPGGSLIVSGLLHEERNHVVAAFHDLSLVWEREEEGWLGLVFRA